MSTPLFLNHIASLDWLVALEFGRVDDGQPDDCWVGISPQVGLLHDEPGGRVVGFKIQEYSAYDANHPDHAILWERPRFAVPALGLSSAPPNEIVAAARDLFGEHETVNRTLFQAAMGASGEEALQIWLQCLQAGDSMAHFALGYTLLDLGRRVEAYRHLRHYAEIAPAGAWNWAWLGRAALAVGLDEEARTALERAIELGGRDGTFAPEMLAALERGERIPQFDGGADVSSTGDEIPVEQWSVEAPFDFHDFLDRPVPTYEDEDDEER
jgi:tetratricopeptide (TPR) repeat protein